MLSQAPWNVVFGILAGLSPWATVAYICLCVWLAGKGREARRHVR
jgi:hypothetical protein